MKFAEITFTNKMADPKHNPSFSSYLLRIPETFNSKCVNKDPEVKIIRKFDAQNIPQINVNLLREFRLYLADLDIKNKRVFVNQEQNGFYRDSNCQSAISMPTSYQWIETLLQKPILDHRKSTIDLLLAPYLVNIRYLSFDQAYSIISDWTMRCNTIRVLEPSLSNFLDYRIKLAIDRSAQYPGWYKDFEEWHLFRQYIYFNKKELAR